MLQDHAAVQSLVSKLQQNLRACSLCLNAMAQDDTIMDLPAKAITEVDAL